MPRARALWLAALLTAACAQPERPIERIVFVTIDTLRADHLQAYGYPRPTSPFLDRLAAGGVLLRSVDPDVVVVEERNRELADSMVGAYRSQVLATEGGRAKVHLLVRTEVAPSGD